MLDHLWNLLDKLKKVDAMLRVAAHNLIAFYVTQIILQNLFSKKVNERLNVFGHFFHILACSKLREIYLWESCLEELNVEFITEKHCYIIYWVLNPQIPENIISELDDHFHDYIT